MFVCGLLWHYPYSFVYEWNLQTLLVLALVLKFSKLFKVSLNWFVGCL